MRARNASDEKTLRTPFQMFHGPSYHVLSYLRIAGDASLTKASSSLQTTSGAEIAELPYLTFEMPLLFALSSSVR